MSGSGDKDAEELFEKYIAPIFERLDERKKKLALRFLKDPEKVAKQMFSKDRRLLDFRKKKERMTRKPGQRAFMEMVEDYAKRRGWIIKEGDYEIFLWEKPVSLEYKIEEGKFVPKRAEEAVELVRWLKGLEREDLKDLLKIKVYKFSKIWTFRGTLWIGKDLASLILKREVLDGEELEEEDIDRVVGFLLFELGKYLKKSRAFLNLGCTSSSSLLDEEGP